MKKLRYKTLIIVAGALIALTSLILFTPLKETLFRPAGPDIYVSSGTITGGDILFNIIKDAGIQNQDANDVIKTLNKKFDTRRITPGNIYEIFHSSFGTIFSFRYWTKPVEYFEVAISSLGVMDVEKYSIPSEMKIAVVSGNIKDNLWTSMIGAGFSPEFVMNFTDIFQWQVDFLTETRNGDTFRAAYEQYRYKNGFVKNGQIIAAEYEGKFSSRYRAVFFRSADGKITDFYAPDGSSLLKLFLRAPLSFRRISSYFTKKRFHPILRYFRPHNGIDYSAAAGTPVVSIGNGTVTFTGWHGGHGRMISVKHNSIYTTMYGHLLKFARGIRPGIRVKQGQVIGYVGSTGLSTGPHLHFQITQNGSYVNFLKLKLPPADNVPKQYALEFAGIRDNGLALLEGRTNGKGAAR